MCDERALTLSERRFGLCDISSSDLTYAKTVPGCRELVAQNLHIVSLHLYQSLVPNDVEMRLSNGLKHRGFDRQSLGARRLYGVDRLASLRLSPPAAIDRLVRLELQQIRSEDQMLAGCRPFAASWYSSRLGQ